MPAAFGIPCHAILSDIARGATAETEGLLPPGARQHDLTTRLPASARLALTSFRRDDPAQAGPACRHTRAVGETTRMSGAARSVMLQTVKRCQGKLMLGTNLFAAAALISSAHAAVWHETEAARGDPLLTVNRCGVNCEFARETSSREKTVPNSTWQSGTKDGRNDWAMDIEMPVPIDNAKWASSEEGLGDLKLKLAFNPLDNEQG